MRIDWRSARLWDPGNVLADKTDVVCSRLVASIMFRKTLFLPLMTAAIGGPLLVFSEKENPESGENVVGELTPEASVPDSNLRQKNSAGINVDFVGVFDFGLSAEMIERKWKHVTRSALSNHQIYRISMTSGHKPTDLAGALTYEFDFSGFMRKIRFTGYLEDPRQLIGFLNRQFKFSKVDTAGSEFRPTAFSGYSGSLKLSRSPDVEQQIQVELWIAR